MTTSFLFDGPPSKDHLKNHGITSLALDSRDVENGTLFFAISGEASDGYKFIPQALEKGANGVVIAKNRKTPDENIPVWMVDDVRDSFAKTCSEFYNNPSLNFYLCGITGTNGKTTLSYLIDQIWKNKKSGLLGTIQISYPNFLEKSALTTPHAKSLQKTFVDMAEQKTSHVVMEVSSHALYQKRAAYSHFDCAVFTNLSQDHLDYHDTLEDYFHAKELLFTRELSQSQKQQKLAIVNLDDPFGKRLLKTLKEKNIPAQSFSLKDNTATIFTKNFQTSLSGSSINFICDGENFKSKTSLIGEFNIENYLASLLVAKHSGIALKDALSQLETVSVPGRLQRIKNQNCYVDFAHTPDALKKVLITLKNLKNDNAKLIVVFGCGGNRDTKKRAPMGLIAATYADQIIITSDNPRNEDPQKIIENILEGIPHHKKNNVKIEPDRKKAIALALDIKSENDIVVVAGKGHENKQIIGDNHYEFDDKTVLENLL